MAGVTPETFLAVVEMIAGHLRLKESDRWSAHICRLKIRSFAAEFPEVNDRQLLWAAEKWLQGLDNGFHRFPTWRELMAPLYRTEGKLANRSWGPKPGLPEFAQFSPEQLSLLPGAASSSLPPPDATNPAAYEVRRAAQHPQLPPAADHGLTDEEWQSYITHVQESASCSP